MNQHFKLVKGNGKRWVAFLYIGGRCQGAFWDCAKLEHVKEWAAQAYPNVPAIVVEW